MKISTPLEAFGKLYRKQFIDGSEFLAFKDAFKELFDNIEDGQVEPTQRKFFTTFMEEIFPKDYLVTHEEDSIDVVLHTGDKTTSPKGVLIELKSTTNKEEMVTKEDINRKALHELLFYYSPVFKPAIKAHVIVHIHSVPFSSYLRLHSFILSIKSSVTSLYSLPVSYRFSSHS